MNSTNNSWRPRSVKLTRRCGVGGLLCEVGGDSSKSKGIKGRGDVKFNEATE